MDKLAPLLERFTLTARTFYSGVYCGAETFDPQPGLGYLHVLRQGRLYVTQGSEQSLEIDEPSLIFNPRPCQHNFRTDNSKGATLVCASVEFGVGMGNPLLRGLPDLLVVSLSSIASIEPVVTLLFTEAFASRLGRQSAVNHLMEYVLVCLIRHAIDTGLVKVGLLTAFADPRLSKALAAMHTGPEQPWSLEQLAGVAGMSRARFANYFHETTGVTPLDYLTDWRLSIAQSLLKQRKSLKLIAPMVGYSDPVALARVFSRRVGVSPSKWLARGADLAPISALPAAA